jgi:serine/threonine protein kinase
LPSRDAMTAAESEPPRPADWEAFYRDYRKQGYVPGFEITSKLGGGMFGLVFRARRMSIGKDYAIKFLQVDDGEVRQAVLSELSQVQYFAQIDHPNLVSIEDRGEVDGIPYLVMAFAGTETLRDKVPAGRAPTPVEKDDLLRWFLQCCRGLSALHERALVHFDIKPANVFLKGQVARLGDYGLSKLVTHSRGSLSMGRGTPYYMAPEMLQRRGDHRSDIYSLGVLLYELLCGRVPFTGDSEWEVLKQHETKAPELPPHLTAAERAVLQRCLAKEPAARFQSVQDLLAVFGAPASAGAAAWTEVAPLAGAQAPSVATPRIQRPSTPASAEDPYVGLGRASREAMKHANTIAKKVGIDASRVAQQAAQIANQLARDAGEVVRSAVERSRTYGTRRLKALQRLRKAHRDSDGAERVAEIATAVAGGSSPKPRGSRWRWGLAIAAATVAALFTLIDGRRGPRRRISVASPVPAPAALPPATPAAPRVAANDSGPTFRDASVPVAYAGLVMLAEPAWVDVARRDPARAKALLDAHIARLRAKVPLAPDERAVVEAVPAFRELSITSDQRHAMQRDLAALIDGRGLDDAASRRLAAAAPRSLAVIAAELTKVRWGDDAELQRAARLHEWLVEATGCRDLAIVDDGDLDAATLAAQNRHLGDLWLWFVNEFGYTQRGWDTFRQLMQ